MVITADAIRCAIKARPTLASFESAGVAVELKRYEGMIHPFLSFAGIMDAGRTAIADAASSVRQALTAGMPAGV